MKKTLLILAIVFCSTLSVKAQVPTQRVCGTLQHHEYLKQTRPNYEADLSRYNQVIEQYLANQAANSSASRTSAAIITIPVVVHVVYNTTAENISDAQAISQVQVLNDDFAKLNTDANKVTQPTFSTLATGSQIRFCLAQRDPNGNATTGVIHKSTTVTSFGTNDAVKSSSTGGDDPWDVTRYVNIWICDLSGSLLGYGEFPTGTISNTWGLVIDYAYTGKGGSAQAPYNLGRTGTHEFGHCFNLLHIWGDDNGACTGSDQCSDTPNQASEHGGSFTAGSIQTDACSPNSPGTMWMNYMDYTDDGSMYMFTAQQVARMEAVVNTSPWNVLASSNGCTPVTALDAGISSIITPVSGSSVCNNNVTPKIILTNAGTTTLTSAIINYKMDAGTTQTLNWTGSLASAASVTLTLNSFTGLTTAAHTFSVWVTSPNGSTDQNSANNSKFSTFTVTSAPVGLALPFTEGFESTTFPPTGWLLQKSNTISATNTWSRLSNTTGLTAGSTAIAKMDNFSGNTNITGQLDALRSPALTFTAANTSLSLSFDVAHRAFNSSSLDTLNVYISSDCGGTWSRLYSKGGTQLANSTTYLTTAFTPTANSQWRRETVSLSSYSGLSSVYVKFESRSGYGNNVYLDNINISYTTTASAPVAGFSTAATKCSGTSIAFSDQSTNTPTSWSWSFPGGTPSTSTVQNPTVTYTAGGTYTVTLTSANASGTSTPVSQTITVNATPTIAVSNASICIGSSTNLLASGATTYSWNTGATTSSISVTPTVTTNYSVTGTINGCTNTKTLSVTVNATPTVAVTNTNVCLGSSVNLTASGATTYSWNTGATTSSISVTPTVTTNYTVIGTNSVGCTNTKTVSVTVKATPTVAVSNATVCSGTAVNLTASGAATYLWNTGATTSSITVTPTVTTNYTVVGTNSVGCANTKTVSVTVNSTPIITVSNATICAGSTATLVASGANTYTWNTGATGSNIAVTPSVNTTYTATGTSTLGCVKTATGSVTVGSAPSISVNSTTICSGNTTTLSASGVTTYTWSTGANTNSISVTPTASIVYTVTGNLAGCTTSDTKTVAVTVNTTPSVAVSNSTVCSGTAANLSATGATSYSWNTGAITPSISVTPTITTNYTVIGTSNGCSNTKTVSVTVNSTPTVAASNATICSGNSVNLIATGATTYSWNTGATTSSISVNPNITTSYTVVGSNLGCSNTRTVTVTVKATPTVAISNATVCSGTTSNLIATGATTYSWNTGATTSSISVTPTITSNYTVTGTSNGCVNSKTVSVTVKATPIVSVSNATVCSGTAANLSANGATTYSWNTGATTSSISVTPTTTTNYTLVGTNSVGCTNTKTVSVTVKATPTVAVANATVCSGSATNLVATGATSYSWNTGATTSSISVTPSANTTYTVVGSNAGCTNTKTVSVTVNTTPTVVVNSATVCSGTSASLIATGATSYSWNTGATTSSISVNPTSTTVYTITGLSLGCSDSQIATVVVNALPIVTVSNVTICAGSTGTLSATGASTYSWNTGVTTSDLIDSPSATTVYTVVGTSVDGCDNSASAAINVIAAPSISANSATICSGSTATLTASGVTTYTWSNTSNSSTIMVNPTSTSVYTVSGNLTGCNTIATQEVTVTVNSLPNVTLGAITGPLCVNHSAVTLVGSPAGGSYIGTGVSGSSFDPAVSGAGTFTLTYSYTDANTCSASATQTVDVSLCTGVQELMSETVSVFPNPTKELINVKINASLVSQSTIELYDAIGKLVVSEKATNTVTTISLVNYARGMYSIRVVAVGKQNIIKVIKE